MSVDWTWLQHFIRLTRTGLDQGIERIQPFGPETLMEFEPGPGILERGGVDSAHPLSSPRFARHEAGTFEHAEVFRDCGERQG